MLRLRLKGILVAGVFTAPASGVYLLTAYARVVIPTWGPMYIKKNDQILCHAELGDGGDWNMGSCTAIVELTPENTVRVTGYQAVLQYSTSGFAGHLIQEYL